MKRLSVIVQIVSQPSTFVMEKENFEASLLTNFLKSKIFSPSPLVVAPYHSSATLPVPQIFSLLPPGTCLFFSFFTNFLPLLPQVQLLVKKTIFPSRRSLNLFPTCGSISFLWPCCLFVCICSLSFPLLSHINHPLFFPPIPTFQNLPEFMLGVWKLIIYCQACRWSGSGLHEQILGESWWQTMRQLQNSRKITRDAF